MKKVFTTEPRDNDYSTHDHLFSPRNAARSLTLQKQEASMNLNAKLMTALLAGVISVGALTACAPDNDASEGSSQTQTNNDDAPGSDNPAANDDAPGLDNPAANDDAPGLDTPGTDNTTEVNDGDGELVDDNNDLDKNDVDDPVNPNDSKD